MVFCTYCGQSFTRDEHLERHILTHTNVKPFKCFTCHMSFARRDLLQRHYTVHGKDQNQEPIPAANGMIPKSAGRTPIACNVQAEIFDAPSDPLDDRPRTPQEWVCHQRVPLQSHRIHNS
ncbi:hypothetical protein KC352_g45647 [Hortaea werneckii]|nr:hypothetical protein KC352_g45647 [Hortaea werneckii]